MSAEEHQAVVMGGSAGSLEALSLILPQLPADFPLPILVVVHLPPDRKSVLAEVLQLKCALAVREAEEKEPILPGTVYFAPPDYHLLVEPDHRIALSADEPQLFSRPSIDVLFESAADVYGAGLLGVVLSGANQDGARGLQDILEAGGRALVQAPEEAQCPAMPKAALGAAPDVRALPTGRIAAALQEFAQHVRA